MAEQSTLDCFDDRNWLFEQYVVQKKTTKEIALLTNLSQSCIARRLKRHGIPIRTNFESQTLGNALASMLQDAAWLKRRYEIEGKTAMQIANEVGVGQTTVVAWLERHSIPRRTYHEARSVQNPKLKLLDDKEWLRHQYVDLGRSAIDISRELNTSDFIVTKWLKKYGITTRNISESKLRNGVSEKINDQNVLADLYSQGMTIVEIASKLGCSHQSVYRRLEKLGFFTERRRNVKAWESECLRVFSAVVSLPHTHQQRFPWLRMPGSKTYLKVDMFFPAIGLCIEFDGIGHFKPIQYRKGQDKECEFAKIKARDAFKDAEIPKHGLSLLRFPWYLPLTTEFVRNWLHENGVRFEQAS